MQWTSGRILAMQLEDGGFESDPRCCVVTSGKLFTPGLAQNLESSLCE